MKITIEAENDAEKKELAKPLVKEGMTQVVIGANMGAEPFTWWSGNYATLIGNALRTAETIRADWTIKLAEAGVISAHNKIAQAAVSQEILADIDGRGGLNKLPRIARQ